ncbi:TetR/AcrR family transcriptional regulator [Nesterenkonia xinjiangensis]|uniref:TetR/AcrR family transcriptional regulator n=1 Tax=Nesterenkonia xinjiangensis TaxID=225327 RepID=UPI00336D969A
MSAVSETDSGPQAAAGSRASSRGGPRRGSARVRLLQAMMALDDHRSVQEHSVEELAAIAGVAKGSVYYQFGSKENLVRQMLVHGAEELQRIMDDLDDVGDLASVRASLTAQIRAAFAFLREYPSFTGLVAYALARRRDDESQQLRAEKEAIVGLLTDRLARLDAARVAEGHAETPSSPARLEIMATSLLSAAVTLSIEQHTTHQEWSEEDCVQALVAMSAGGLG